MERRLWASLVAIFVLLSVAQVASAQSPGETRVPGSGEGSEVVTDGERLPIVVPAAALAEEAGPQRPADLSYGVAMGLRWVTVPAWLLNVFTKNNVPLSSWGTAISFFRRKANFDLMATIGYQNMSPPDGNWLAKGHDPAIDTDYVQFRNFAMYTFDVSFVWNTMVNDWFGIHYGAGVGVAYLGGDVLRTSNANCTDENAGDLSQCHPQGVDCANGVCDERQLAATRLNSGPDDPTSPKRFSETNVPPILPIVNVLVGVNFRLPKVRGWEAKIQGGFYNAFVLGGAVAYTF